MDIVPTDRTRRVLALARQAANARHANDIGTSDILHGLAMEGSGIAWNVLRAAGITFGPLHASFPEEQVREQQVETGSRELAELHGEAKRLMDAATDEAKGCRARWPNDDPPFTWIGTEHVLLALTLNESLAGAKLLRDGLAKNGMTLADLRRQLFQIIGIHPDA